MVVFVLMSDMMAALLRRYFGLSSVSDETWIVWELEGVVFRSL